MAKQSSSDSRGVTEIQTASNGVLLMLRVNGVTCAQVLDERPHVLRDVVDHALRPGDNEIELFAQLASAVDEPKASVWLERVTQPGGAPLGRLLGWAWDHHEPPLDAQGFGRVLHHRLHHPSSAGRWGFESAPPLDEEHHQNALACVIELHQALEVRDTMALIKLLARRTTEHALAAQCRRELVEAELVEELTDVLGEEEVEIDPCPLRELVYEPRFNHRVVFVRKKDGTPPLVARAAGKVLGIAPGIAKLDEGYRVVR